MKRLATLAAILVLGAAAPAFAATPTEAGVAASYHQPDGSVPFTLATLEGTPGGAHVVFDPA